MSFIGEKNGPPLRAREVRLGCQVKQKLKNYSIAERLALASKFEKLFLEARRAKES